MTLREVSWAADGAERAEWGRAAGLSGMVWAPMTKTTPLALIPPRYRPKERKPSDLERAIKGTIGLAALNQFFREWKRGE